MAKEIERKFLVRDQSFKSLAIATFDIRQAYLSDNIDATVRLRIVNDKAWLTVKSRNKGCVRNEWEYEIPISDAIEMIRECGLPCLHKTRYIIPAYDGLNWEVDEFISPKPGLIVAEIELKADNQQFDRPEWLGSEVTGQAEYYNSAIIKSEPIH